MVFLTPPSQQEALVLQQGCDVLHAPTDSDDTLMTGVWLLFASVGSDCGETATRVKVISQDYPSELSHETQTMCTLVGMYCTSTWQGVCENMFFWWLNSGCVVFQMHPH